MHTQKKILLLFSLFLLTQGFWLTAEQDSFQDNSISCEKDITCTTTNFKKENTDQNETREQDVALLAQEIIFARKRELVSAACQWAQGALKIEFSDQEVLIKALEVATALDILELYAMGLEYSVVQEANGFYSRCFLYWKEYSKETQAVLSKIYATIKKYFA